MLEAQEIVSGGQLWVASLIALAAGLVSFASPCVLPLVPGYLAYVGGVAGSGGQKSTKWRVSAGATLFVLGFTVIFVLINAVAGGLGAWLFFYQDIILRVMGVVVIAMGFIFLGFFGSMQNTKQFKFKPKVGLVGAPLLGIIFAIGWAPCMGPTLGTIMTLSMSQASATRGVILAIFYSLGLGLPFILLALGFGWMSGVTSFLRKHIRAINIAGGVLMIAIGILMVTGIWNALMSNLQVVIDGFLPPL
ncbi:MAG TPA: cytochrome c biogenesis protein CcdA [Microbacteriaceae bacterium]|nr:cytochrome c biogenesis protein CcdA [Microbacteriaceae bacterium]